MDVQTLYQKIAPFFKSHLTLILLLVLTGVTRFAYIDYAHPLTTVIHDEADSQIYWTKAISGVNPLRESVIPYPTLLPFLQLPFFSIKTGQIILQYKLFSVEALKSFIALNGSSELILAARYTSALAGTVTVLAIYKILGLLFERKAALFGAFSVSISILAISNSHWGKPHMLMTTMGIISLYFALKYEKTLQNKYWYGCCAFAGLSLSTHLIGIWSLIFPLSLIIKQKLYLNLKTIGLGGLLGATITGFFYLTNLAGTKLAFIQAQEMKAASGVYAQAGGAMGLERYYFLFRDAATAEPIFFTIFCLSLGLFIFKNLNERRNSSHLVFMGMASTYLVMITVAAMPKTPRFLLPFTMLSTAWGMGFFYSYVRKKWNKSEAWLYTLLIPNIIISTYWTSLLQENTLVKTRDWILKNTSPTEKVYTFSTNLEIPPTLEVAKWQNELAKKHGHPLRGSYTYILEHPPTNLKDTREVYTDNIRTTETQAQELAGENTKYIVVTHENIEQKNKLLETVRKNFMITKTVTFNSQIHKLNSSAAPDDENLLGWRSVFQRTGLGPEVEIYSVKKLR